MPDITLCDGVGCPLAQKCYRVNATINSTNQSWFVEAPYQNGKCEHFWDIDWKKNMKASDELFPKVFLA